MLDRNIRAKTFWRMSVLLPYVMAPVAVGAHLQQHVRRQPRPREQHPHRHRPARRSRGTRTRSGATSRSRRWSTSAGPATTRSSCSPRCRPFPATTTRRRPSTAPAPFRQFWSITLPSLRPTLIFVIITSTIGGLQIFDEPRLYDNTGQGGAAQQWLTITLFLYNIGWRRVELRPSSRARLDPVPHHPRHRPHQPDGHPPPRPRRGRPRRHRTAQARRRNMKGVGR